MNSRVTGQQDDYDYNNDREEELDQIDGTMDIYTPTDNSDDNEGNEPVIMHIKDKERYIPQLIQLEKK